jgi:hypothetical protein
MAVLLKSKTSPKWARSPIIWKTYISTHDDFGNLRKKPIIWAQGWGPKRKGFGIADSYSSAIALNMGLWEEYCLYFRNKE